MHNTYDRQSTRRTLRKESKKPPLDGYPPLEDRLYIPRRKWRAMLASGRIEIPDGPWHITDHDNRRNARGPIDSIVTSDNPLGDKRAQQWLRQGFLIDTLGRPLHPLAELGLTTRFLTRKVGMYTGPGRNYRYGPQLIGNLGLRRIVGGVVEYAAVATRRSGGKIMWSLPGGHAELGQTAEAAAFSEAHEEAGIPAELIRDLPSEDRALTPDIGSPNTLHSWLDEHYHMVNGADCGDLENLALVPEDTEEVVEARWMSVGKLAVERHFMGSHRRVVLWYEEHLAQQ